MEIWFLLAILAVVIGGFFFLARKLGRSAEAPPDQSLLLIQNQINELTRTLDTKLGESSRVLERQFGESTRIIKEITQELVKVSEGQKQVVSVTDQLRNLQDILKNPKQRGILGEYYLETVLKNVLPPGAYKMQYPFKDGTIVDAAIFVKEKVIPVDSKFSLENYNRLMVTRDDAERERLEDAFASDLKMRIDETAKYIKPAEGTMDFAFMFIPSEAIYYDLLVNKVGVIRANTRDLLEYATRDKKVIPVSPTSFLAYLQTVLQGLRALQIEESAKEIKKRVEDLRRHLEGYEGYMKKLGTQLGTTVGTYNTAYKEFGKIDRDVLKINGKGIDAEPILLERPHETEEGQ